MAAALVLALVLVVGDNWDDGRFRDLRESTAFLAAAGLAGAVVLVALAALFRRRPEALPLLAVAALPFRIPVEAGGDSANLLLPLYVVIAAGVLSELWGAFAAGGEPQESEPVGTSGSRAVRYLPWALAGYVVLYAAQGLYSDDFSNALEKIGFFLVPFAVLAALLVRVEWNARLLRLVFTIVIAEAALFALVGFAEYGLRELIWNPTLREANELHAYFRVNSLFWDPNILGRYLAIAIVLVAAAMLWERRPGRSAIFAVVAFGLLAGLAVTFSQSSLVALLAALAVLAALRWTALWTGVACLVVVVAMGAVIIGGGGIDLDSEKSLNNETSGRAELIRGGVELAAEQPIAGYGTGSFESEYTREFRTRQEAAEAVSHTEPVTVAAEQGAIGLIVYVAVIAIAIAALAAGIRPFAPGLRGGGRALPDGAALAIARAALLAALVAMVVHSLFYAAFFTDPITWTLLAIGITLARDEPIRGLTPYGFLMFDYLRRLARTGAAYTASSVLSKLIAVALLPLYTRYLTPADYGAAEVMVVAVIAASIVIRLGVIEALMRFYYVADEDREQVVKTGFASLFWTTTVAALIALPFAEPISRALLDSSQPDLVRIAIGGLWIFTLYEYLVALFRLDERAKAYLVFTMANVLLAIPLTVWLVVFQEEGAKGLLLGTYGAGLPFLLYLIFEQRHRLSLIVDVAMLRRMFRFGLPTMPAELSLYSLQFIDRIILVRLAGLAEAGLYALAIRFAQGVTVLTRGFQLAWPPLAYSVQDDTEAKRVYALIVTWFLAVCTFTVIGFWLLARWIVRILAAPEFFESYEAIGLLATGVTMYALYLVLVVILGRTGRTEFNLPATAIATVANIGLNLALIPPYGIVGAGLALVGSYVIVLGLMYWFTQRLFPVPYEWGRLALIVGVAAALVVGGELLLPTEGIVGLISRTAVWFAFPLILHLTGFLSDPERARLRQLREQGLKQLAEGGPQREPGLEAVEAERRDEDARP